MPKSRDHDRAHQGEAAILQFGGSASGPVNPPPPGSKKEYRKRSTLKVNLGQRWTQIMDDIENEEYSWAELVSSLTPAELARGQLMDKNGNFTGRPPTVVPRAFFDACIRELLKRGSELYKENYISAINAMTAIANDTNAKASDRIKAAEFVIQRLEGKVPDKLEVTVSDNPFAQMVEGAIAEIQSDATIANAQKYADRRA